MNVFLCFLLFGLDDAAAALVVSAIIGAVATAASTAYTNKKNEDLTQENRDWQEAMMNKQNEYNSPAEQMQRYKEAGINPSTIGIASGAVASGNLSASPPSGSTIPHQGLDVTGSLSNLASAFNMTQEGLDKKTLRQVRLEEIQKHIQEYDATIKNLNLNSQGVQIANSYMSAEKTWAIRESQGRVRKLTSEFGWNYQQIAESQQRVRNMVYELDNVLPEEVKKIISERKLNVTRQEEVVAAIKDLNASAELKGAQTEFTTEQRNTEEIRQADLLQDVAGKTIENANRQVLIDKYLDKYSAEIKKLAVETDLTEEQAFWYVFELADKNTINFMGIPLGPGQAYRKMQRGRSIGKEVINRYGVE